MAFWEADCSVLAHMRHLMGWLRRFLAMFVPFMVAGLLLLLVTSRRVLSTMGMLFLRDQVTRMASVELWVVLTTLLLVLRFLLDFFGPWEANRSMTRIIITIEMLNYSMVHYTIGLMQLSGIRANDYFQVWAVLLVTLQYSVKIGRPYSRSKQIPLLDLMSSFWTANLLRVQTFFLLRIPLWTIWALNAARIISFFSSSDKADRINQESNRFVADYMSYEHKHEHELSSSQLSADANINMQVYKYVISGEDQLLKDVQEGHGPTYPIQDQQGHPQRRRRVVPFDPKYCDKLITLDKIWGFQSGKSKLLGGMVCQTNQLNEVPRPSSKGPLSYLRFYCKNGFLAFATCRPDKLKDVCLSFALYKLLRRRFYDLPIHEAKLVTPREKIRRLVFKYILQDSERAFRVAGIELSFLQDLIYSKHAAMFANGFPIINLILSLLLVAATVYIAVPVRYIPQRMDQADRNSITHGVFITRVIIFLIVVKELAEVYMYVFSQWTKVLILCSYVKYQCMSRWLVEMVMRVALCLMSRGTWDERIRQHNLLISTRRANLGNLMHLGSKFPTSIKLEDCTKKDIFNSLKEVGTKLEALEKTQDTELKKKLEMELVRLDFYIPPQFHWALDFEADTHKVLVWHIATCLCEVKLALEAPRLRPFGLRPRPFIKKPEGDKPDEQQHADKWWEHYITAASLSNYCMHLVTQALVPDNGLVAKKVFQEVRWEISSVTSDGSIRSILWSRSRSMEHVYYRLMDFVKEGEKKQDIRDSLTWQGASLAENLMGEFCNDWTCLWMLLSHLWTRFLLYLATSTRASKHRAHLAGRRELVTHLWALLSHAGFLGSVAHGHTFLDREELEIVEPMS